MESFKGNGAECMVQFIKDGCKGLVCHRAPEGKGTAPVLVNRHIWENAYATDHLGWLAMPCEYYPPEPTYRDATPGEALDAWLACKEVRAQNKQEPEDWANIGFVNGYTWQFARDYKFRIRED